MRGWVGMGGWVVVVRGIEADASASDSDCYGLGRVGRGYAGGEESQESKGTPSPFGGDGGGRGDAGAGGGLQIDVQGKEIRCLGTGPEVPVYLRFNGIVRNRRISKRDAEKTVSARTSMHTYKRLCNRARARTYGRGLGDAAVASHTVPTTAGWSLSHCPHEAPAISHMDVYGRWRKPLHPTPSRMLHTAAVNVPGVYTIFSAPPHPPTPTS